MGSRDKYSGTVEFTNEEYITILQSLKDWLYLSSMNGGAKLQIEAIDKAIETLSQPELIYCGDCKYKDDGIDEAGIPFLKCLHGRSYGGTRINDFCSWAKRREVTT